LDWAPAGSILPRDDIACPARTRTPPETDIRIEEAVPRAAAEAERPMKTRHRSLPILVILAVLGAHQHPALAQERAGASLDHLRVSELWIETAAGERHRFRVYEARSPEERRRGLMFVTDLDPDEGMLFDSGRVEHESMWMRNTPLPLDMLFVRADGSIARIERETVPYSRTLIHSGTPVRAVIELNGGIAAELGIRAGDRVEHPLFETGGEG
jgi:uncharacterized membrane protein (UPF0127 family)